MIAWIITCFTTPHCQMTMLQQIGAAVAMFPLIVLVIAVGSFIIVRIVE